MFVPHIGIVGVTQPEQVAAAIEALEGLPATTRRPLVIMVHACRETLEGDPHLKPSVYPAAETITSLFRPHDEVQHFIRYTTDRPKDLAEQLKGLIEIGGPHLSGIQLGMSWPRSTQIALPRTLRCVLEIGPRAVEAYANDFDQVANRIQALQELVDGVLIRGDVGMFASLPHTDRVTDLVRAISARRPRLNIGIACDLSPQQIAKRRDLARRFPNLSLDLEWKPREHDDHMPIISMRQCITAANALFNG